MMMENNMWNIIAGRFILGLGAGLMTVFVPMSVSGMAPPEFSGPLGMINQIMCCVGILSASLISLPAPSRINTFETEDAFWYEDYWRVVLCVPFWMAFFQALLIYFVFRVELPVDLKKKGDVQNLTLLMSKIYETKQVAERIQAINVPKEGANDFGYAEALTNPKYRKATLIACFMGFAQIATGINAIIQYSGVIFNDIGMSPSMAAVIINGVCLVASCASYPVPLYAGRKTILIVTFGGQTVALVLAAVCNQLDMSTMGLVMICLYLVFFQFGPGPVMWLYNAEIASGSSLTLATAINWFTNCCLSLLFPILTKDILYPMFYFFALVSLLATVFALCILKETKGLNSEQLANLYAP